MVSAALPGKLHQKPTRAYGRVFYFGKQREEIRKRALAEMTLGNIEPEWDDLICAEIEVRQPTTSHTDGHGPVS
jgi:hypothetical protein